VPTTPIYGLRFPAAADTPDVPRDIGNLAADVEAALGPRAATGLAAGECQVWNGTAWVRSTTTKLGSSSLAGYPWKDADIDPAAAIAYAKLALAGAIVNADIAAAAAIALSKLAGYPADGTKFAAGDGTWKTITQIPTGMIAPFAGSAAPAGWLLCDGTPASRTTYAALFAVLGTAYGAGDGSTSFGIPDLRGRVPFGKNTASFNALGAVGGEETHSLTIAELASHTHVFAGSPLAAHGHAFAGDALANHGHAFVGGPTPDHNHLMTDGGSDLAIGTNYHARDGSLHAVADIGGRIGAGSVTLLTVQTSAIYTYAGGGDGTVTGTIVTTSAGTPSGTVSAVSAGTPSGINASTGNGTAHNNVPPYQVVNYIIKF
jgi:microcystin-dependent protein